MFTKEELIEIRNLIDGSKDKLTDETSRIRNSIGSKIFSKLHGCSREEPVGEDLEVELKNYLNSDEYINTLGVSGYLLVARHFANWQKEQMMKDAIKCEITWMDGFILNYTQEQQDDLLEKIGAKVGDKVKLVIIKED